MRVRGTRYQPALSLRPVCAAGALALGLVGAAPTAHALEDSDMARMLDVFDTQCLTPLMQGQAPSTDGFRDPSGEAAFGYSASVTRDDKVMLQVYEDRGLWGCGTTNSVYTVPAEGPGFDRMLAALQTYSDRLAEGPFDETTECMMPIEGSWARAFVGTRAARPNTYVKVLVSATETYANGGPSLQEHYGAPVADCEVAQ